MTNPPVTNPPVTNPAVTEPPKTDPAGPWPTDALTNLTKKYGLGSVQDAALDEGHNLWLLNGDKLGVLKGGETAAKWSTGVGQAGAGYQSTVICAGAAGTAYVGYATDNDIPGGQFIYSQDGCEFSDETNCDPTRWDPSRMAHFQEGDLDIVKLDANGAPALDERIYRNSPNSNPYGKSYEPTLGLRNTNDQHFDEDRSVYSCTRAVRGPAKGDIFVGTNHGYTRIQGKLFNSHRHPIWYEVDPTDCPPDQNGTPVCKKSQRAGFAYGIGIAQDGDVLMANDWAVGMVTPIGGFETWHKDSAPDLNPEKLQNVILDEVYASCPADQVEKMGCTGSSPSMSHFAYFRGFEQTTDGKYYVGSKDLGLWEVTLGKSKSAATATRISGVSNVVLSLAATADGSLFIGASDGLYKMDASKQISRVAGVSGQVTRLFYDPSTTPAMLLAVAGGNVYLLRGN